MANAKGAAAKKPAAKAPAKAQTPAPAESAEMKKKPVKKVEPTDEVTVVSCYYGGLKYRNKNTGYVAEWGQFGDSVIMTVGELSAMRNGQRAFFENQWILLTGDNADAVISYLQLDKYYQDITSVQDIDNLFLGTPDELPGVLARFSPSAKETIARRAHEKIENKELSDINVIRALESSLGFDLLT